MDIYNTFMFKGKKILREALGQIKNTNVLKKFGKV